MCIVLATWLFLLAASLTALFQHCPVWIGMQLTRILCLYAAMLFRWPRVLVTLSPMHVTGWPDYCRFGVHVDYYCSHLIAQGMLECHQLCLYSQALVRYTPGKHFSSNHHCASVMLHGVTNLVDSTTLADGLGHSSQLMLLQLLPHTLHLDVWQSHNDDLCWWWLSAGQ